MNIQMNINIGVDDLAEIGKIHSEVIKEAIDKIKLKNQILFMSFPQTSSNMLLMFFMNSWL